MKRTLAIAIVSSFCAACQAGGGSGATATLKDGQGATVGTATFAAAGEGVTIEVDVKGLAPGEHGIHLHDTGKCDGPKFESAGAHLNPANAQHGLENPSGPHAGDMPNLKVEADGSAKATLTAKTAKLDDTSIFKSGGTALVIHSKPDDHKTDPSGNSGDRVVCGVIERS